MPRMQVYLPDVLYAEVKARKLPASELLQAAVQAEIHRLDLLAETDRYLAELGGEVAADADEVMTAQIIAQRLGRIRR